MQDTPFPSRRGILLATFLAMVASAVLAVDPVVSNVRAQQRAGTKLVDITYNVVDPDSATLTVTIAISSDGGTSWTVPCTHATGDIGPAVPPGTAKAIVWDAGADWNGQWSEHMRVQVTADDTGVGPPPADEFVLIPGGTNSGTDPDFGAYSLTVSSFYMGRTEVTNELSAKTGPPR